MGPASRWPDFNAPGSSLLVHWVLRPDFRGKRIPPKAGSNNPFQRKARAEGRTREQTMRTHLQCGLIVLIILFFSGNSLATPKGELLLWKKEPFLYGLCGHCSDLFTVAEGKNVKDLNYANFISQSGVFTLDLKGPAGTTVTLFGAPGHKKDRGYLTLVKKDDSPIAIDDLEAFAPGVWVDIKAQAGDAGGYSAWYQPHADFTSSVTSVLWGSQ